MSNSRIEYMHDSAWKKGNKPTLKNIPPFELPVDKDALIIDLPEPDLLPEINVNFLEMVELRSTIRTYNIEDHLSMKELSYLLWCTQGVKMIMGNKTIRNVPSAGGRNALETYLYINRVSDLAPGLYRFLPIEHKLVAIPTTEKFFNEFANTFSSSKVVLDSAITFLWVAVYDRMSCLFGNRAYRYIHLDAGHVCENLYYSAQTMNIKTCPLGAFDDEALNNLLKFDGIQQFAVYGAAIGK